MKTFSVIVPVYNVEKYLGQCVDSVLKQTCEDLELILVDDGSTDGSGTMCDTYAARDGRVRVIHQKNGGLAAARNAGAAAARNEYIVFLDSDDWWGDSDFLDKAAERLEADGSDMLLFGFRPYIERRGASGPGQPMTAGAGGGGYFPA